MRLKLTLFSLISFSYFFSLGQSDSLIAYYPFNSNTIDVKGGYNGTKNSSGVYYDVGLTGELNSALMLKSDESGFVSLGNPAAFDFAINGQFSISIWVKQGASNYYRAVIVRAENYNVWDYGMMIKDGTPYTGTSNRDKYAYTKVNDGNWHHIVTTYNNGTHKIYVDGVLEKTATNTPITNNNGQLVIGRKGESPSVYYDGLVDELKIFNKELNQNEISTLYGEKNISVSTKNINTISNLDAYPNPCSSYINIKSGDKYGVILLYNSYGSVIYEDKIDQFELKNIDLSGFSKGIYFIELYTEKQGRFSNRIIKK